MMLTWVRARLGGSVTAAMARGAAALAVATCLGGSAFASGKVALVLSGGGAAGAAHVGVIRALEEAGVRPDCVAGTSMGAIVGGLYASGMPVDRMTEVVREIDWFAILDDGSDRDLLHPLRRRPRIDPRNIFNTLPLGADRGGVRTDAGLIDGNRLLLILRELTLPVAGVTDFDDLPIPFRAVATDLASGEPVVLGDGDLAVALRASMSLPGLFPPVVVDDQVLVDGGVANNLPIDIGRSLCASDPDDVIIAVTIPQAETDVSSLTTFTGALGQTLSLLIRRSTDDQLERNNGRFELLAPAVGDISTVDFPRVPEAMEIGYQSTRDEIVEIAALVQARRAAAAAATPPDAFEGRTRGGFTLSEDPNGERIDVRELKIENDTGYDDEVIRAYVDIEPPTTITTLELSERLERLYGLQAFDLVTYRVDNGDTLVVIVRRRQAGRTEFRIGSALEDNFDGRTRVVLGGGVGFTQLDPLGRRVDLDAAIGTDQLAAISVEQPLDYAQQWFLTGDATYSAFNSPVFESPDSRLAEYRFQRFLGGVDLSYAPIDTVRLGAGPFYRWRRSDLSTGDPAQFPESAQTEAFGVRFGLNIDQLDAAVLPTRGFLFDGDVFFEGENAIDGELAATFNIDTLAAVPVSFGTIHAFARGSADVGELDDPIGFNRIGGFQRLSGFERDAFVGDIAGVAGLRGIARADFIEGLVGLAGFAGGSVEFGGAWDDFAEIGGEDGFFAGSIFLGLESRFGPIYIGVGHAEAGNSAFYLGLGERF